MLDKKKTHKWNIEWQISIVAGSSSIGPYPSWGRQKVVALIGQTAAAKITGSYFMKCSEFIVNARVSSKLRTTAAEKNVCI